MNCENKITYVLQRGDNLYQIAQRYKTTTADILALNPGINPMSLKIGSTITLCPGPGYSAGHGGGAPASAYTEKQCALKSDMRKVWIQHVYWTRMVLLSIAERLKDQPQTTARLLKNPADIAAVFRNYYSADVAKLITSLLTEHLQIGAELITALRDKNSTAAAELQHQWYANADKMAAAFSSVSPYYKYDDVKNMLYEHLKLTTLEVQKRLEGKYAEDIAAFDKVEQEALEMADYFTAGLIKQFPQKFTSEKRYMFF